MSWQSFSIFSIISTTNDQKGAPEKSGAPLLKECY